MAIVAAHAAVRPHLENGVKELLVNALLMRPGKVGASTTGARHGRGTGEYIPHQWFTLLLLGISG